MKKSELSTPVIDQPQDLVDSDKKISRELDNMFISIPGITWQDKLDFLRECKCCYRHMVNKPYVFSSAEIYPSRKHLRSEVGEGERINACTCPCRHQARFICRQYGHIFSPPNKNFTTDVNKLSSKKHT